MSDYSVDPRFPEQLRLKAESLLLQGLKPRSTGHIVSADVLWVLYRLARSSESAADSLKILHELQTHQIELELQLEQSEANERDAAAELERYKAIFEFAPVAYFIISREGFVMACNQTGVALFADVGVELEGVHFEALLASVSRPAFNWHLKKLFNGSRSENCTVEVGNSNETQHLRIKAGLAPDGNSVFMTLIEQESPAAG
jgi:PAS domain-containing protein